MARTPIRRKQHFKTVNGVRFTWVRTKRAGERTMTPGQAMTLMLSILRKGRAA